MLVYMNVGILGLSPINAPRPASSMTRVKTLKQTMTKSKMFHGTWK